MDIEDNYESSGLKYPSYIVNTDDIVKHIVNDNNCVINNENTNDIDNNVPKKLTEIATVFNQLEHKYNNNNQFYYGEIPYYIYKKIINKESFDHILNNIIIKSYGIENYTNQDYDDIAYLIIMIILHNYNIENSTNTVNTINNLYNIITTLYTCYNYYFNIIRLSDKPNLFTNTIQDDLIFYNIDFELFVYFYCLMKQDEHSKTLLYKLVNNIDKAPKKDLIEFYNNISFEQYLYNYFIEKFNNQQLQSYINPVNTLQEKLFIIKDYLIISFEKLFKTQINNVLNSINFTKSNMILRDVISKIYNSVNEIDIYIYTSMLINLHESLPPIESNDEGNGRLSEFLLSNVYEQLGMCMLIKERSNESIENISRRVIECMKIENKLYEVIDNYILFNLQVYTIIYYNLLCNYEYNTHPLRKTATKEEKCLINYDQYNIYTDLYNKLNIYNTKWILLNYDNSIVNYLNDINNYDIVVNNSINDVVVNTINIIQNYAILFRPLRPLSNYYSKIFNDKGAYKGKYKENYKWFRKNKNIYDNSIDIFNDDVGGDLFSVINKHLYIIDSKRYSKGLDCQHEFTTFLQTYMYMNAYAKPLAFYKQDNQDIQLFDLYLGIVNPIDNIYKTVSYIDFLNQISSDKYNTYLQYYDRSVKYPIKYSINQFLLNHINNKYHLNKCVNCSNYYNNNSDKYINTVNKITETKKYIKYKINEMNNNANSYDKLYYGINKIINKGKYEDVYDYVNKYIEDQRVNNDRTYDNLHDKIDKFDYFKKNKQNKIEKKEKQSKSKNVKNVKMLKK